MLERHRRDFYPISYCLYLRLRCVNQTIAEIEIRISNISSEHSNTWLLVNNILLEVILYQEIAVVV